MREELPGQQEFPVETSFNPDQWKPYRKRLLTWMRPYQENEDMTGISVSDPDKEKGSPKSGDMIASNPENPRDRWLVSEAYFKANYVFAEDE